MTQTMEIFDTTLRDGTQSRGIDLSVQDRLEAISLLDTLGISPVNLNKTLNFIINCSITDGGFKLHPLIGITDFTSGWAAMNALSIIEKNNTIDQSINIADIRKKYYNWLYDFQAKNVRLAQP